MKNLSLLSVITVFAFALYCMCFPLNVSATIVVGSVGSGNFTDWEGNVSTTSGLDFNNDGNLEFAFQSSGIEVEYTDCMVMWTYDENGNNVWSEGTFDSGSGWDEAHPIALNTLVGPSATWGGEGDCSLISFTGDEILPLNQEVYLGFRIKLGDNIHYGWAKVKLEGSATSGVQARWLQIAYENTPNTPILAGQTSVGIEETHNLAVSVFPNPIGNTINIISNDPVLNASLFDINGKVIFSSIQVVDNQIDVANVPAGMYFLTVNALNKNTTIKVIKK